MNYEIYYTGAEGAARNHQKEFIQFLYIAQGSVAELETQLIISQNLQFINEKQLNKIINQLNLIRSQITGLTEVSKKLTNLIKYRQTHLKSKA